MDTSPDYEDLFKILNAYRIRYLMIGGQAVIFYSEPRFTKDMDVWIPIELNKPETIYQALREFGAPLTRLTPEDFKDKKMILQIGVAPVRIDIMMGLPGIRAEQAWKTRRKGRYGRTSVNILNLPELIQSKRKAGRPQDKLDVDKLTRRANGRKR